MSVWVEVAIPQFNIEQLTNEKKVMYEKQFFLPVKFN